MPARRGSRGADPGELDQPKAVAVDSDGFVYVADRCNHRVAGFEELCRAVKMRAESVSSQRRA